MNLKNQLCTLEQAKRLKELGVFYPNSQFVVVDGTGTCSIRHVSHEYREWCYPVFSVAELMEMLGPYAQAYALDSNYCKGNYGHAYRWNAEAATGQELGLEPDAFMGFTLAEALGKRLIYSIESEEVTVQQINSRLHL